MQFFVGIHQPCDAKHFSHAFISVNRLRTRKSRFKVGKFIMDSGAFTELFKHGEYRHEPEEYALEVDRWRGNEGFLSAVSQDYMCEPFILEKTGLTLARHHALTLERYVKIKASVKTDAYVMPVLQGYAPSDYVEHIRQYGDLIAPGAWIGVGSVCKRNGDPSAIIAVLDAIKTERPDIRLHGFGVKTTALRRPEIRVMLETADSMAWSFAARKQGGNRNGYQEALNFYNLICSLGGGA